MSWLQSLDETLFRFLNHTLSNAGFDVLMPWLSGNRLFIPSLLLLAAALVWRWRGRAVLFLFTLALALLFTDTLVCNSLKHWIGRPRPCITLAGVHLLVGCTKSGSMPSAHAANWAAATVIVFFFWRRGWRVTALLAAAVGCSRIFNGVHYPGDVVAGWALGAASGLGTVKLVNATWRRAGKRWFPLWQERWPVLVPPVAAECPSADGSGRAIRAAALNEHWLRAGYVLLAVLALGRWLYLASETIELSGDEAYQWVWSKHLALSYYSKPLLIACTQWLGTALWGDNAFGVRFFSPLIAALIGGMTLRFFARADNARAGFILILIFTATPLLAMGTTLMTVDPLAVLFWTAAMFSGWRAVQENSRTRDWVWTGLWMGLGFLSKYTSPLQWLCWAVFFACWPPARAHLRRPGPYLALGINLLCTLPVVIWNWQHGWITVQHVARHGGAGKTWQPTLAFLGEFVGAEFGLLNPVFFVAAVIAAVALWRARSRDVRSVYCFSMGAPVFLLYLLLSLKSYVLPNWIAPAVLPLFCLMALHWDARWRAGARAVGAWLVAGLLLGLFLVVVFHDTNLFAAITGRPLPPKFDPLTRVRGYAEMARVVSQERERLAAEGKPVFLIGSHYGTTSLLNFYLPEARARVKDEFLVYYGPNNRPDNQYYFWPGYLATRRGQNALFVRELSLPKLDLGWMAVGWIPRWLRGETNLASRELEPQPPPDWLKGQFESVTDLGLRHTLYRGRVFHTVQLFECRTLR